MGALEWIWVSISVLCLFFRRLTRRKWKGGGRRGTKCTNVALYNTLKPLSPSCFMQLVIFPKCFLMYHLNRFPATLRSVRYWIRQILSRKTKEELRSNGVERLSALELNITCTVSIMKHNYSGAAEPDAGSSSSAGFFPLSFPGGGIVRERGRFFFLHVFFVFFLLFPSFFRAEKFRRTWFVFLLKTTSSVLCSYVIIFFSVHSRFFFFLSIFVAEEL